MFGGRHDCGIAVVVEIGATNVLQSRRRRAQGWMEEDGIEEQQIKIKIKGEEGDECHQEEERVYIVVESKLVS